VASVTGTTRLEAGLLLAIVVMAALLLIVRLYRSARAKRRRANGTVYFDTDAAHYGRPAAKAGASGGAAVRRSRPASRHRPVATMPTAGSFTAPRGGHRAHPTGGATSTTAPTEAHGGTVPKPRQSPVPGPPPAPARPSGTISGGLPPMPAPPPAANRN